jgi:hypothetical protein
MNVINLMKKLGGEVLANKARVVVDGKIVIIGRLIGDEWEPTLEGLDLEARTNTAQSIAEEAAPVAKPEPKKSNARKAV